MRWGCLATLWHTTKKIFETSNTQEIALAGALPSVCGFSDSICSDSDYYPLDSSRPLASRLDSTKPRALVFLVGMGTPSGFLLPKGPSDNLLPESWWANDGPQSVGLFAVACHSAEYLEKAEITSLLQGVLCYNGEVWLSLCNGTFWRAFWLRLRSIAKSRGGIDDRLWSLVRKEYDRQVRRASRKKADYLTLLCLVDQKGSLQLLGGDQ